MLSPRVSRREIAARLGVPHTTGPPIPASWRNIETGWLIPDESYADQPYIVKGDDGAWQPGGVGPRTTQEIVWEKAKAPNPKPDGLLALGLDNLILQEGARAALRAAGRRGASRR